MQIYLSMNDLFLPPGVKAFTSFEIWSKLTKRSKRPHCYENIKKHWRSDVFIVNFE